MNISDIPLKLNFSDLNIKELMPECLSQSNCLELCNATKFNIFIQPFALIGLSIIFSWVAYMITEYYDELILKYPNKKRLIQKIYSACSLGSLICQATMGVWVLYLTMYGVN